MPPDTRPGRTVAVLLLAVSAFALSQTAVIPALGAIARDRQVSVSGATWVLTAYLMSAAVLAPLLGRLSDLFGSRRLLVITLAVFTAGAAIAAASPSLAGLVLGRALQGVGGAVLPICYGIVRRSIPEQRRAVAIGILSGTMSVGGGIGLVVGGVIVDHGSYRWIFVAAAVMGASTVALVRFAIPALPPMAAGRVDVVGGALLSAGVAAGVLALSLTGRPGWTTLLSMAAVAALTGFVLVERRTAAPMVHLPTFTTRSVVVANAIAFLTGYAIFTMFVVVPQLMTIPRASGYGFGRTAVASALVLLPGTVAMLAVAPATGYLARRWTPKLPLVTGCALAAAGQLGLAADHGSVASVAAWSVVGFIGLGQVLAALPNLIIDTVPVHRIGEATGVNSLIRLIGGAIGSQAAAVLVAARTGDRMPWPAESGLVVALLVGSAACFVGAATASAARGQRL
ncbi:MFS transporter [Jiangella alba]|uniref:Major Facilitator Superfamily protein n=1 Tax=Jiangella alba TaxID=561176 RepID=A0A1H5K0Y9_9ACTN|nr:MFS transporter [Jiangella alba]SEE58486.1 Major Facilitator Superfamily protein [Jiangella alba]